MNVLETWINGEKVFENNKVLFNYKKADPVNNFSCTEIKKENIEISANLRNMRVIEAFDGDLDNKGIQRAGQNGNKNYLRYRIGYLENSCKGSL